MIDVKLGKKQGKNRPNRPNREADLLLTNELVRSASENLTHDAKCLPDSVPLLVTSNFDARKTVQGENT